MGGNLVHGDFSRDQVVLGPGGEPSLIDLDSAAVGEAATDLGSFWAALLIEARSPAEEAGITGRVETLMSGYDTLRRPPDRALVLLYRRRLPGLPPWALASVQARLLDVLWPLLTPGGRLLYCTCSVFRAEGEAQVQTFLAHNTGAVLRPAPGHLLPQSGAKDDAVPDNLKGDHDGFFYALLEKRAAAAPA